jgi:hypothetical protein
LPGHFLGKVLRPLGQLGHHGRWHLIFLPVVLGYLIDHVVALAACNTCKTFSRLLLVVLSKQVNQSLPITVQ